MPEPMPGVSGESRDATALREIRRLVDETVALTGSAAPETLDVKAPTLVDSALDGGGDGSFYLIGLIGGKNVGKSSLVNALVGQPITAGSSHGPGTEKAIAYVHESQVPALRALLDAEVAGRYEIVRHSLPQLARQVLLDLPDFDSHYDEHVEVTRRMLRHMLYPIWIQSIEKYADRQARELLLKVTAGNAPRNFIFVLNKLDQLVDREGQAAARELRDDYAARLSTALQLDPPPRVWMVSAVDPAAHDLPALRELVNRERSVETVARSRQMAVHQQSHSLMAWFDRQQLPERLGRVARLEEQAQEDILHRVAGPIIEEVVPRMLEDRAVRAAVADEVMQKRVARWPMVNMLHVLLDPIVSALRLRLPYGQQWVFDGAEILVARHVDAGREPLAGTIQAIFARLQQSNAAINHLYAERRYWDAMPADTAAAELRRNLALAIEHQRREALLTLTHTWGAPGWIGRLILTVGAALWFPIVQPILEAALQHTATSVALLFVQVLGVNYLLKNVGFLLVYFLVLWLALKWRARYQVDRWFDRWKHGDPLNPEQSLTGQVLEWSRGLTDPITQARGQLETLIEQATVLRTKLEQQKAA